MTEQVIGTRQKRYDGEYVARVVNVDDPKKLMRVQVHVETLFDGMREKDLPWATYKLPVGARLQEGFFTPVKVGDYVWVDFPFNGDSRQPRITGSVHYCPDMVCYLPDDAWKGKQPYEHKRTGNELMPTEEGYHRDTVIDQHGVLIELVDPTGEVRVTQKKTGSAVEIDKAGNVTAHSENNLYGSSKNNTELIVGKDLKVDVTGNTVAKVGGNATVTVTGRADVTANAGASITAPTIQLNGNLSQNGQGGSEAKATEIKNADTKHTGSYHLIGDCAIDGNCTIDGGLSVTGTVKAPYFDGLAKTAKAIG